MNIYCKEIWKSKYFRAFLLIILPFLLSFFILFSPNEKIPLTRFEKYDKNGSFLGYVVMIDEDEIFKPSPITAIRDIFNIPYGYRGYQICFEDGGSYFLYGDGSKNLNITWTVNLSDKKIVTVKRLQSNCEIVMKPDTNFTYMWRFKHAISLKEVYEKGGEVQITPFFQTDAYAKPEFWSVLAKNGLFVLSWMGVAWLFTRMWTLIKINKEKRKQQRA